LYTLALESKTTVAGIADPLAEPFANAEWAAKSC
jgi:hypothetical protein